MKNKILTLKRALINSYIYRTYYNEEIDEELVYVESRDGKDFTGNILRIVEELSTGKYGNFKIVVYAKKYVHLKIQELKKNYSLKIHSIVEKEYKATKILEKAKYIITDSGMRPKYVKRPGQIVIDTWHGTPLKVMGYHNKPEEHRLANIQQVFFACDYLLYPNNYMKEKMLESYMMNKLYPGKILLEGYPRNSIFFKEEKGKELKEKLGFEGKEIFGYMPTFKGVLVNRKDKNQKNEIEEYLTEIDANLKDNQILLVKLHVYNQEKLDFSKFKHVKPFPNGYEIYDILNMTDCLITDYSSVMFDYANTKRKIVLFNYDEEEYIKDRGFYFSLDDLPFPKVQTIKELINEINTPKNYNDSEFLEKFCIYDRPNAVEYICKHIFNGEKICKEEEIKNDKENILIYGGGLLNNGLTSSLMNLLSNLNTEKYNYFISYPTWNQYIADNHYHIFNKIPKNIGFAPLRTILQPTLKEKLKLIKFSKESENSKIPNIIKKMLIREEKRSFYVNPFKTVIQFNGYGINETLIFSNFKSNKIIWVHNDMIKEIETRSNQFYPILKYAYNSYNNVVVVSPDLIEPTSKISGRTDKIKLVHNINNFNEIKNNASKDIILDDNTTITCYDPKGVEGILKSKGKKFITIGRFSPEKGHERLIKAFEEFCEDYPDTKLIIIGGHGENYEKTIELVENSEYKENICIIKWISNPMPILSKCDLFIISSFYEGWPMVIMEADTLNIPIIATDITGTQWMKDYNGHIVDNSQEGILQGMYDFIDGKVNTLGIDYEEYNKQAVQEFIDIL
ncbi:MAG: CDP-glycerol glycerophosphotransferase family protein [archaeon]|nr:CDP-glycerol glycerophosphotransferase family protein [archaeon]